MAVPEYQKFFVPVLRIAGDKKDHSYGEMYAGTDLHRNGFMATRALKSKASDIRRIARSHGVSQVRVFGSHAAGRAKRTSDVDLLITLQSDRDLLDLVEFKLDIQDLMGCDVEVVTENGLSPYLRRTILRTTKPLE